MHTQEKPTSSYANTNNEAPRSYEEEAPQIPSDVLRRSLLTAPESRGNQVPIPAHTVAVRMNISAYNPNVAAGMSNLVNTIQEHNVHGKGWGELAETEALSSLDKNATRDREAGETFANVTFLYDGQPPLEDEIRIPSAVIVHEEISELRIRELREKLPEGVPILDGKTNELLDDIGREEREIGRNRDYVNSRMGAAAMNGFTGYQGFGMHEEVIHHTNEYMSPEAYEAASRLRAGQRAMAKEKAEAEREARHQQRVKDNERARQRQDTSTQANETTEATVRADSEADAYAENDRRNKDKAVDVVLDTAKEMYGDTAFGKLDDKEFSKVERKVRMKLHPDRGYENGGDHGAFQEAEVLMSKVRAARAAQKTQDTPDPEAATKAEAEPAASEESAEPKE